MFSLGLNGRSEVGLFPRFQRRSLNCLQRRAYAAYRNTTDESTDGQQHTRRAKLTLLALQRLVFADDRFQHFAAAGQPLRLGHLQRLLLHEFQQLPAQTTGWLGQSAAVPQLSRVSGSGTGIEPIRWDRVQGNG